jgi:TetR/AcrR family transcriptional repressor of nem operon
MTPNSKQRILEVSSEIVLKMGFQATTVDQICEAAEVSKGSFYHFFKSKEDMGLALLAEFYEEAQRRLFAAPWASEPDPGQRLVAFLTYSEDNAESFWGEGCLLGGFAIEVAETNDVFQEKISVILGSLAQRLAPTFEPAAREGGPTAAALAEQYLATIEGAIVLARGHRDPGRIGRAISVYADHVARLLEKQPAYSSLSCRH